MDLPDIKKFLLIDKNNLDEEWAVQAKLYYDWSIAWAKAEKEKSELKQKSDLMKAKYDKTIRTNPTAFNLPEKTTEAMIANAIIQQPEVQENQNQLIEAQYDSNVLNGILQTLHERRVLLDNLTRLYSAQYFVKSPISMEGKSSIESKEHEEVRKEIAQRRKLNK